MQRKGEQTILPIHIMADFFPETEAHLRRGVKFETIIHHK